MDRRWTCVLCVALVGTLPSCGGDDQTCFRTIIAYTGSKTGVAYLRTTSDDGGQTLSFSSSASSIQVLAAVKANRLDCWRRAPGDIPVSSVAWIDVAGTAATTCADLQSAQCQPSPTDPQVHQGAVLRYGQVNEMHLNVIDPL